MDDGFLISISHWCHCVGCPTGLGVGEEWWPKALGLFPKGSRAELEVE